MPVIAKYERAIERLSNKIENSITPVPGFIVGISGTDSIVAFMLINSALRRQGKEHRLIGIHYADPYRKNLTWIEREIVPWIETVMPTSNIVVRSPAGHFVDHFRWADMLYRSTHDVFSHEHGNADKILPYEDGQGYWVSGTINATEKALGKYSICQKSTSIQPIIHFWKTEILELCHAFGVPDIAMQNSRIPDCLCGRDDFAAANIELIDKVLKYEDTSDYERAAVAQATEWVRTIKKSHGWRARSPYEI